MLQGVRVAVLEHGRELPVLARQLLHRPDPRVVQPVQGVQELLLLQAQVHLRRLEGVLTLGPPQPLVPVVHPEGRGDVPAHGQPVPTQGLVEGVQVALVDL